MLDWAILIGGIVGFILILWRGYRWLRREEPEEQAIVVPDTMRYAYEVREPASASADEIAARVFDHERAQQRQERADALLQAVTMGHLPDQDELELLTEYFNGHRVNSAISTGMWSSTMKAIDDLTQELEDLKAAQPTLIVAEMPERVG